jgi:hypothetical protein
MLEEKYMKPLWRALDRVDRLFLKAGDNYDPLTLCEGEVDALGFVASHVGEEKPYDADVKAAYLLGLAVGFRYAGVAPEKIDQLIASSVVKPS